MRSICLTFPLLFLTAAVAGAQDPDEPTPKANEASSAAPLELSHASPEQIEALKGKWRVVKVHRDGKPQHGQVGQEVDDIITIKMELNGAIFFG